MARIEDIQKDTTKKIKSLAGQINGLTFYGESHKSPNLITYPYKTGNNGVIRGIRFSYSDNGIITANGTVSETTLDAFFECSSATVYSINLKPGTYRISSGIVDEANNKYWAVVYNTSSTELARSTNNNGIFRIATTTKVFVQCRVYKATTVSNLVFKPMLQEVEIGTNKIPYPYYSPNNWEQNKIIYTINPDHSVTANGTSTAVSRFYFYTSTSISFAGKRVRLSGCPSGGSNRTYAIYTQGNNQFDYGDGCVFDYTSDMSGLAIVIYNGQTVNNLTFKPMLEIVDESVPLPPIEYEPYKETYQEEYEKFGIHPTRAIIEVESPNLINQPYYDRFNFNESDDGFFEGDFDDGFVDHGVSFSSLSGGIVVATGTATGGTATMRLVSELQNLNIGYGRKFVLSGGINADKYLGLHFYKKDATLPFKSYYSYDKPTVIEDMVNEAYERVQIQVYIADGTYTNDMFYPMIVEVQEDGSYPTTFEGKKTSRIDSDNILPSYLKNLLYSVGDERNTLVINDSPQIYGKISVRDMGDLNYTYSTTNNVFNTTIDDCVTVSIIADTDKYTMCEGYDYEYATLSNLQDGKYRLSTQNTKNFSFKNSNYTTVAAFKEAMAGKKFIYVSELIGFYPLDTYAGSFKRLETFAPYSYVTSNTDILLNYNWYEWQTPKIDWVADDYFNFEDYIRIGNNLDAVYDFSLSLYEPYEHITPEYRIDYTTIPYADTWNVINDNLYAINNNTVKLDIGTKNTYYDNGRTPDYVEFNKWETSTVQLMEELRRKARTLPRLSMKLGEKTIGSRY